MFNFSSLDAVAPFGQYSNWSAAQVNKIALMRRMHNRYKVDLFIYLQSTYGYAYTYSWLN